MKKTNDSGRIGLILFFLFSIAFAMPGCGPEQRHQTPGDNAGINSIVEEEKSFFGSMSDWSNAVLPVQEEEEEVIGTEPVFVMTPSKTLAQVRDEVRDWRGTDSANAEKPAVVQVESGSYYFDETVEFDTRDSFTKYVGKDNAIFTRGKEITNWEVNEKGWFVTTIPEVSQGDWWFEQLFVNGRRAEQAKSPNQFYHYVLDEVISVVNPKTNEDEFTPGRAFIPRKEEESLFELIAGKDREKFPLEDVQIKFFHSWETSTHRLQSYDPEKKTVLLTGRSPWNLAYWGGSQLRYQIAGLYELLDTPGEFYLDRNGTLTYIPLPGETLENTSFFSPDGPKTFEESGFIRIVGKLDEIATGNDSPDSSLFVQNISFENIAFEYSPFTLPPDGLCNGQAAILAPVAVYVEAARNISFERCRWSHLGGCAIWFHRACRDCCVEQCFIHDIGTCGIRIGTTTGKPWTIGERLTKRITIHDNMIRNYGQIDAGAVGLWIGHGAENRVTHNDISGGLYTGISCGWVWGYSQSPSINNIFDNNHIHNIGQGVLSDMGGFYMLGISPGTKVTNNVIHDVYSYNRYGRGGWGLYTDEGSTDILLENNLVYRVHTGSIHQHYGEKNTFRNNILAFSLDGQLQRSRNEEHLSFTIENNIIVWEDSALFSGNWQENKNQFLLRNNLYWCYDQKDEADESEPTFFNGKTLSEWQSLGNDAGSLLTDPQFVDPVSGDFRFQGGKPNEAVEAIGFVPFDYSQAGLTSATSDYWGDRITDYEYPSVILAPDAPPMPPFSFFDDFEGLRLTPAPRARLNGAEPHQYWTLNIYELDENGKCKEDAISSHKLPFSDPLWKEFKWFGFSALGSQVGTLDIDNVSIREFPGDDVDKTPFVIDEDFQIDSLSQSPASWHYENIPGGILLQTDEANDNNTFIRMNDNADYRFAFDPHFFYTFEPLMNRGVVSFDYRLSSEARLHAEARGAFRAAGYQVGPSLVLENGLIKVGGQEVKKVSSDSWHRLEIDFPVGESRVRPPFEIVSERENKFLRINDDSTYPNRYDPHLFYTPDHETGISTLSFKMRLFAGSELEVEGRDNNSDYRTSFYIHVADGVISTRSQTLGNLENDKWYEVTISIAPGEKREGDAPKEWSLTIIDSSLEAEAQTIIHEERLPIVNPDWCHLQWIGFVSNSLKRSHVDLDDIRLSTTLE